MKYLIHGVQLNVLEQGDGPLTLVFMHYFGGSCLEWQSIIDQLSGQYRCVAFDLRGHGNSDAPAIGYSVDNMANDLLELIRTLVIDDFVLIGHSLSGKVALSFAAGSQARSQPPGLRSLLLISPSPPLPEPIPDDERQQMIENHGQQSAAEQTFEKITARSVSEKSKDQIIKDNLRTSRSAWDAWLTSGSRENIADQLSTIDIPVYIVVGTKDQAIAPDVQTTMTLPYLKNATLDTIKDAGHLLPWETPDELTAFIQKKIMEY